MQLSSQNGSNRYKGILMVLIGATLWGINGTVAQSLFQYDGFDVGWLVTVRLLGSGLMLLVMGVFRLGLGQILNVWKDPHDRIGILIFGIVGMLGVQYTYFTAIQSGNAAIATLLQYVSPVFIVLYLAIKDWRLPNATELIAVGLALLGTFLIVTNGSTDSLSVPVSSVIWGIASAVALAFYTLYPVALLQKRSSTVIIGWGMLIGGAGLALFDPPWHLQGPHWSLTTLVMVAFVIIFGTLIPFYLFLDSMRYITSTEASILGNAEPLAAVIVSVIWLNVPFGMVEGIGGLCIISTVFLLSMRSVTKEPAIKRTLEG